MATTGTGSGGSDSWIVHQMASMRNPFDSRKPGIFRVNRPGPFLDEGGVETERGKFGMFGETLDLGFAIR